MGGISPRAFSSLLGAFRVYDRCLALICRSRQSDVSSLARGFLPGNRGHRARRVVRIASVKTTTLSSHTLQRAHSIWAYPTTVFSSRRQEPFENAVTTVVMPACIDEGRAPRKERSRRLQSRRCFVGDLPCRSHTAIILFTSSFKALASDWADWSRRTMRSLGPGAKGACSLGARPMRRSVIEKIGNAGIALLCLTSHIGAEIHDKIERFAM